MPGIMFQDVVSPRSRSNRKWYTLPLSFVVHTGVLAVLVVVPLIATTDLLPTPRALLQFVTPFVHVVPSPPPILRATPSPAAHNTGGAPVVAPTTIGVESGVIFEPGDVATGGIENIAGVIDVGQLTVDAPPPVAPAPSGPIVIGGNIKAPTRTRYVPPQYPDIARSARVEGVVIIEAIIGSDGKVEQARVLRSKPFLDEAALAAVRAWEYTPTLLNDRPVPVIMTVTVQFSLR
jgi:periplasmic protein TonB